jgi:hypothetical protein
MGKETIIHIYHRPLQFMHTKRKLHNDFHQNIQIYWVVKVGYLPHQGQWLTRSQIQQKFPHLMREIYAIETIDS